MSEVLSMGFDTCMSTLAPSIYNPVNVLLQTNPDADTDQMQLQDVLYMNLVYTLLHAQSTRYRTGLFDG